MMVSDCLCQLFWKKIFFHADFSILWLKVKIQHKRERLLKHMRLFQPRALLLKSLTLMSNEWDNFFLSEKVMPLTKYCRNALQVDILTWKISKDPTLKRTMTTQLHSSAVVISLTFFDIIVCASGCPRKNYFFRAFYLKNRKSMTFQMPSLWQMGPQMRWKELCSGKC